MQTRVRKNIRILIVFFALTATVLFGVWLLKPVFTRLSASDARRVDSGVPFRNSPLDKYDFTECKVRLCDRYSSKMLSLTQRQQEEFLENLFRAEINKYALSVFAGYNGGPVPYMVELESGETVKIHHEGGPHLTIGEKTYKCYSEDVLNFFDELEEEIYRENYPDRYN
ncbi:MAG: hypothetical protein NC223_06645 [Butyrivibrio sp.]|nr:hypothetical protein [Butyrivibrio sp.]